MTRLKSFDIIFSISIIICLILSCYSISYSIDLNTRMLDTGKRLSETGASIYTSQLTYKDLNEIVIFEGFKKGIWIIEYNSSQNEFECVLNKNMNILERIEYDIFVKTK